MARRLAGIALAVVCFGLARGSLQIESTSMVLNRSVEGNELYLLVFVYLLLCLGLSFAGYKLLRARGA